MENFRPEENLAVVKFHRVPGQWLPVWELARLLKVRREKLLELIDEGEIGCAYDLRGKGKSRATIRIPPAAVIAFLERTTISTATARRRVLKILSAPSSPRRTPARFTARRSVIEYLTRADEANTSSGWHCGARVHDGCTVLL